MPYADPERQREAMREIMRKSRKKEAWEALKEKAVADRRKDIMVIVEEQAEEGSKELETIILREIINTLISDANYHNKKVVDVIPELKGLLAKIPELVADYQNLLRERFEQKSVETEPLFVKKLEETFNKVTAEAEKRLTKGELEKRLILAAQEFKKAEQEALETPQLELEKIAKKFYLI